MKLTITFPDTVAKRVCRLPNPDEFVTQAVEKALEQEPEPTLVESSDAQESKWARLIREVEDGSMSLGESYEQFNRDRAEFRESFRFKHDEDE
ncbi:MAG TPA: hypothetical protein VE685_04960 [Thermoanaerobaculia bacterium]|nr:hypothetical protein [Thermoanaerobaculia bacterium]